AASANAWSSPTLWSLTRCDHLRPRCAQRGSSISTATLTYHHTVAASEAELRNAWHALAGRGHDRAFESLLARYREPHRRYHTTTHIMWVLRHVTAIVDDS